MAGEIADKVVVELEARLSKYNSDVKQGASSFDQAMKRMLTSSASAEAGVAKLGGAVKGLAGLLTLTAAFDIAKKALDYASSLGETAQQLGVTTKTLQVYRFAAGQFGVATGEMDAGLRKLTLTMGKAQLGADGPTKAFAALSKVLGEDILATAKTTDAALPKIADGLSKIGDSAKRHAIEVELLGRAGQKLDPLLTQGSKGLNELAAAAEKMGIVLSEEQIQRADAAADSFGKLKTVLEARIAGVVADNAGAILNLANALGALTGRMIQFMNSNPRAAAGMIGAIAGFLLRGPVGAVAGGLMTAGLADQERPAFIRQQLNQRSKFLTQQYVRYGGTEEELRTGKINPRVAANPHIRTIVAERQALKEKLKNAEGGTYAAASVSVPDVNVDKFLSPSGTKKSSKDHSEQLAKETERLKYQMDKEELEAKRDLLSAQRDITVDIEDRANISDAILQAEHDQRALEIQHNLRMVQLDETVSAQEKAAAEASAKKQVALNDQVSVLDRQGERLKQELARSDEFERTEAQMFDVQRSHLQLQEALVTTAGERRKIELELLEISYKERKAALQRVQNETFTYYDAAGQAHTQFTHSQDERTRAGLSEKALDRDYPAQQEGVKQATRGPLEQMLAGIPDTAAEANEALQQVAAQGLQSLSDGIVDAIMHAKSLGDVFTSVAKQIIAELIKIELERAVIGPLANAIGSFFGMPATATATPAPGRASGGNVSAGSLYRVNELGVEGFRPAGSGTIIPLGQMVQPTGGQGGGMTVLVTVNAQDAVLADTVRSWVMQGVQEATARGAVAGRAITLDRLQRQRRQNLG